jgi:chromosome segregation ATPase
MNRLLQIVNLLGVLALAGLCAYQWKDNGRLHGDLESLERTRQEQATKIADQEKTIQGNVADLEAVRDNLSKSEASLKETQGKLSAEMATNKQLTTARDQLAAEHEQDKAAIEKWSAALALRDDALKKRDDALKEANAQMQKLMADRNDAVGKFNDLVSKYNGVVKQLNGKGG